MKKFAFIIAAYIFAFTACKTIENRESALEGKRMEIEAITARYSDINLKGPVDWGAFQTFFKEDLVVEHLDLAKYESCLEGMVNYSNNLLVRRRESGCDDLNEQAKLLSGNERIEFREKNIEAFNRCDSIMKTLTLGFDEAFAPCLEILSEKSVEGETSNKKK